jgi:hypothetical protein
MQDYKDGPGDVAAGRITLPIAYPTLSRALTALLLVAWSRCLSWTWRLDAVTAGFVGLLGLIVGVRLVTRTDVRADTISSHLYNVSFTIRGCPSVSYAIFPSFGFVRHFYSLNITGCAWFRDQVAFVRSSGLGHLYTLSLLTSHPAHCVAGASLGLSFDCLRS